VTLTITGEAETTATIYDADGGVIGTVQLSLEGTATFTLPPSNGQDVTVTLTDAAENESDPTPAALPDTLPPEELTITLENDTGDDGDGITSDGTVNIGNLEDGASWEYSLDGGDNWEDGTGTSFELPVGEYAAGDVQVRQTDAANNTGPASQLDVVTVAALVAANDTATADLGSRVSVTHPSETDESLQVLGLLDDGNATNSIAISVAEGSTGDVVIEVSQSALLAVADAFNVEIYDADGELVGVLTTGNDPLLGDVAGLGVLGLTSDSTLVANVQGLAPGDYTVVVRKGESALGSLLDTDGDGISLEELGQGGVVLGAENQELVLNAVETALNGVLFVDLLNLGLGTVVRNLLEPLLDTTTALGAGEVVQVLSEALGNLGLTGFLDDVLGALTEALLSNTLTLIQDTSVTVTLTEHSFSDDGIVSGNVIDPDAGAEAEPGEDSIVPGTQVTQVVNGDGTTVEVEAGTATIDGEYGTLVINADGSYTYTPNGDLASVGQTDEFTYTISDGTNSVEANLSITIDGERLTDDTAQAGIEYDYVVTDGPVVADALTYSWVLGVAGIVIPTIGSSLIGDSFTVEADTEQDVTLDVNLGGVVGLGVTGTLYVEVNNDGNWSIVNSYDLGQLIDLLGLGGSSTVVASDLPEGVYRTRVSLSIPAGIAGGISVDMSSQITHLDQLEVSNIFPAEGDLFDNDLIGSEPVSLSVSANGLDFTEIPAGGSETIDGNYGSLLVNADGTYVYTPNEDAPFGQQTDVFTYQVEIDGVTQEATLTVTVNGTLQGGGTPVVIEGFTAFGDDVVPLGEFDLSDDGDADSDASLSGLSDEGDGLQLQGLIDDGEGDDGDLTLPGGDDDPLPSGLTDLPEVSDPLGYLSSNPDDDLNNAGTNSLI